MARPKEFELAKLLRKALEETGLSYRQVSIRSGVAYQAVHGFMRGTRDMTLTSAGKLCALVGMTFRRKGD